MREGDDVSVKRPRAVLSSDGEAASRINIDSETKDELSYFGRSGRRLFGCLHTPLNKELLGGVVICSPTLVDFDRNYRREFILAGSLAARGFAVQRFHYRGSGNSEDAPGGATLQSMAEDALTAAQRLTDFTGVSRLGFVGTRMGAFISATAARRYGSAPLALWEPVIDPSRYFHEAMRSRLMRNLKLEALGSRSRSDEGEKPHSSISTLEESLGRTGLVDIIGYPLHRSFFHDMQQRSLAEEIDVPRPIQILQVSLDARLRGDYVSLAERLEAGGCEVQRCVIADKEEAWWFVDGRPGDDEHGPGESKMVEATTEWFLQHLHGGDVLAT